MPGIKFSTRCPSNTWNDFDAYGAFGKMRIGTAVAEGKLKWTPKLLEILYADPLCGACDVGCKRNLDLEIELSLEALRVKAVKDGAGPMPAHKKVAQNIAKHHNQFGSPHENRKKWLTGDIQVAPKADVLYFVGCSASYLNPEIAQATARILNASATPFMLMPEEWCCGNTLFSVGMIDEARAWARRNIDAVKAAGAKTLITSCAEGYRMWKPEHFQDIVLELRYVITSSAPDAVEVVRWGGLSYFHAGGGGIVSAGICQIGIHEDHIRLAFIHGAFLPDPQNLLEGTRKAKRFVRIEMYEEAPWEYLRELIASAAKFDPRLLEM